DHLSRRDVRHVAKEAEAFLVMDAGERPEAMMSDGLTLPSSFLIDAAVRAALAEDVGGGDLTTLATVPAGTRAAGQIVAREAGVLAGLPVAARVFQLLDPRVEITPEAAEGGAFEAGDVLAWLEGEARALLMGERVALNF